MKSFIGKTRIGGGKKKRKMDDRDRREFIKELDNAYDQGVKVNLWEGEFLSSVLEWEGAFTVKQRRIINGLVERYGPKLQPPWEG